jgi:hypothetical protein
MTTTKTYTAHRARQAEQAARDTALAGFKPVGIAAVVAALRPARPLQPNEVRELPPILRKAAALD